MMNAITPIRAAVDLSDTHRAARLLDHAVTSAKATENLNDTITAFWVNEAEIRLHELAAAFGYTLIKGDAQ